jgi:hypothetical protein
MNAIVNYDYDYIEKQNLGEKYLELLKCIKCAGDKYNKLYEDKYQAPSLVEMHIRTTQKEQIGESWGRLQSAFYQEYFKLQGNPRFKEVLLTCEGCADFDKRVTELNSNINTNVTFAENFKDVKKNNTGMIIFIVLLILALIGGVVLWGCKTQGWLSSYFPGFCTTKSVGGQVSEAVQSFLRIH